MCLIFKRLNTAAITDDIKLEPWSLSISSGIPNLEKTWHNASATVLASIFLRGMASGVTSCKIHEC